MGAILIGGIAFLVALIVYAIRVDQVMRNTPPEALKHMPRFIDAEEIRSTYEDIKKNGIDFAKELPPRRERRYVVVGGSGEWELFVIFVSY